MALLALAALAMPQVALAQKGFPPTTVTVGGQPMASDKELPDNLVLSADHRVFTGLLKSSGLLDRMRGREMFTVFAPTDAAFAALPPGELARLQRPENAAALKSLLALHIAIGNFSTKRLQLLLRTSKGPAELETLDGAKLVVAYNGPSNLVLRDPKGGTADITLSDVKQANGVVFVIDRVLQPAG